MAPPVGSEDSTLPLPHAATNVQHLRVEQRRHTRVRQPHKVGPVTALPVGQLQNYEGTQSWPQTQQLPSGGLRRRDVFSRVQGVPGDIEQTQRLRPRQM